LKYRHLVFLFLTTISLVLLIESFSFLFLNNKNESQSFLFRRMGENIVVNQYSVSFFNEIDPLLGWAIEKNLIEQKGYRKLYESIVIDNCINKDRAIKILITGGSTTDLIINPKNWPSQLGDILSANNYCAQIFVASVAGYNSGQELLKLLRMLIDFVPDIHISYSGANEAENPSYTSYYERLLYEKLLSEKPSAFMPNTVFLVRKYLLRNTMQKAYLKEPVNFAPDAFWMNNMLNFYAIAQSRNYCFMGILQPVLGQGGVFQKEEMEALPNYMRDYEEFYPNAKTLVDTKDYLYDFTYVFSGVEGKIFKDDCHLSDVKYQRIVADSVFNLIKPLLDSKQ
jgi:hypothetical protein